MHTYTHAHYQQGYVAVNVCVDIMHTIQMVTCPASLHYHMLTTVRGVDVFINFAENTGGHN